MEDEPPPCSASVSSTRDAPSLTGLSLSIDWSDWRWQMRHRIRSLDELAGYFPDMRISPAMLEAADKFPLAITPYYASLIRQADSSDPVFLMSVPQDGELLAPPFLSDDPLDEDRFTPVPGLIHRYRDRALIIATSACAMYCRHCTRKRMTGARETCISALRLQKCVEYLLDHPEIRDVVISGGDPLTMSTESIERILSAIRSVPSIEVIRFGSRTPVTLPQRITEELTAVLKKHHPIWINTHFNHPAEITPESRAACTRLVDAGIPLGNQAVLLRGVNDDVETMETLFRGLVAMRVRPYYLFQCDLVRGVEHFRTPVAKGIEIMEALRGRLSGIAIPAFVLDAPHGGGKIPIMPNYIVSMSTTNTVLRSSEGMMVAYPEPSAEARSASCRPTDASAPSVWHLSSGSYSRIEPVRADGTTRRQPGTARDHSPEAIPRGIVR